MAKKNTKTPSEEQKKRLRKVLRQLKKTYPDVKCALTHDSTFQLLVATILSAQCTDVRVNATTPLLFEKYPTAEKLARASETGIYPAIATPRHRRRFLRTVLSAKGITNPVLSFEEIGIEARPSLVGLVPA